MKKIPVLGCVFLLIVCILGKGEAGVVVSHPPAPIPLPNGYVGPDDISGHLMVYSTFSNPAGLGQGLTVYNFNTNQSNALNVQDIMRPVISGNLIAYVSHVTSVRRLDACMFNEEASTCSEKTIFNGQVEEVAVYGNRIAWTNSSAISSTNFVTDLYTCIFNPLTYSCSPPQLIVSSPGALTMKNLKIIDNGMIFWSQFIGPAINNYDIVGFDPNTPVSMPFTVVSDPNPQALLTLKGSSGDRIVFQSSVATKEIRTCPLGSDGICGPVMIISTGTNINEVGISGDILFYIGPQAATGILPALKAYDLVSQTETELVSFATSLKSVNGNRVVFAGGFLQVVSFNHANVIEFGDPSDSTPQNCEPVVLMVGQSPQVDSTLTFNVYSAPKNSQGVLLISAGSTGPVPLIPGINFYVNFSQLLPFLFPLQTDSFGKASLTLPVFSVAAQHTIYTQAVFPSCTGASKSVSQALAVSIP